MRPPLHSLLADIREGGVTGVFPLPPYPPTPDPGTVKSWAGQPDLGGSSWYCWRVWREGLFWQPPGRHVGRCPARWSWLLQVSTEPAAALDGKCLVGSFLLGLIEL